MEELPRQHLINLLLGNIYKVLKDFPIEELDKAIDQYEHVIGGEPLYIQMVDRPFEYFPIVERKLEVLKKLRELKKVLE